MRNGVILYRNLLFEFFVRPHDGVDTSDQA